MKSMIALLTLLVVASARSEASSEVGSRPTETFVHVAANGIDTFNPAALGDPVPLSQDDLRSITMQVMQKHPLLSSSAGIKHASAQRSVRSIDIASLVYFPHAESNGMKYAFELRCLRQAPAVEWVCEEPDLRRYLKLESQDFEVRITVGVTTEVALALIEATRATVEASRRSGAAMASTAIHISRDSTSYVVSWGSPEGYPKEMVRAQLKSDGSPARPEDWLTAMLE